MADKTNWMTSLGEDLLIKERFLSLLTESERDLLGDIEVNHKKITNAPGPSAFSTIFYCTQAKCVTGSSETTLFTAIVKNEPAFIVRTPIDFVVQSFFEGFKVLKNNQGKTTQLCRYYSEYIKDILFEDYGIYLRNTSDIAAFEAKEYSKTSLTHSEISIDTRTNLNIQVQSWIDIYPNELSERQPSYIAGFETEVFIGQELLAIEGDISCNDSLDDFINQTIQQILIP